MNPWVIRRRDAFVIPRVDTLSRYVGVVLAAGSLPPTSALTPTPSSALLQTYIGTSAEPVLSFYSSFL